MMPCIIKAILEMDGKKPFCRYFTGKWFSNDERKGFMEPVWARDKDEIKVYNTMLCTYRDYKMLSLSRDVVKVEIVRVKYSKSKEREDGSNN